MAALSLPPTGSYTVEVLQAGSITVFKVHTSGAPGRTTSDSNIALHELFLKSLEGASISPSSSSPSPSPHTAPTFRYGFTSPSPSPTPTVSSEDTARDCHTPPCTRRAAGVASSFTPIRSDGSAMDLAAAYVSSVAANTLVALKTTSEFPDNFSGFMANGITNLDLSTRPHSGQHLPLSHLLNFQAAFTELSTLSLSAHPEINLHHLAELPPSIITLDLSQCPLLFKTEGSNDTGTFMHFPKLSQLDLSSTLVKSAEVIEIIEATPTLSKITLKDCPNIAITDFTTLKVVSDLELIYSDGVLSLSKDSSK